MVTKANPVALQLRAMNMLYEGLKERGGLMVVPSSAVWSRWAWVPPVAAGSEIIIAKAGKPLAKLVAFRDTVRRKPGRAKGLVWISDDFDAPLPPDLQAAFNGDVE